MGEEAGRHGPADPLVKAVGWAWPAGPHEVGGGHSVPGDPPFPSAHQLHRAGAAQKIIQVQSYMYPLLQTAGELPMCPWVHEMLALPCPPL